MRAAKLNRQIRLPVPSRATLAAAAAMLGLGLFLYRDCVFFGRALFQRDIDLFWYGNVEAAVRAIASGSLPLWNPYPAFGQPLLAVAIGQLLYPATWLNLLMAPDRYYTLFAVLHLAVTGLGAYVLARRLGASWVAATTAGLLWAACGPFQSLVHMANMYAACAWLPWAWAAAHATLVEGRLAAAVGWGVTLALTVLAGSPETTLMATAGALVALPGRSPAEWRRVALPRLGLAALAGLLGLLLSAAQWLPTLEMLARSGREALPEIDQLYWSNHPAILVQWLLPLPLDDLPLTPVLRAVMFEELEPFLFSIYMGLASVPLMLAGAAHGPRKPWPLVGLLAVSLLVSFGRYSPVYDFAAALLPLERFRFPSKFTLAAALSAALLAGRGVDAVARGGLRPRLLALLAVLAGTLAFLALPAAAGDAALWQALLVPPEVFGKAWTDSASFRSAQGALLRAGLLAAGVALALALRAAGRLSGARAGLLAAVLAVLDAGAGVPSQNPTVPRELLQYRPEILRPIPRDRPNRTLVLNYRAEEVGLRTLRRRQVFTLPFDITPEQLFVLSRAYPSAMLGGAWGIEGFAEDVPRLRGREAARLAALLQRMPGHPAFLRLLQLGGVQYLATLHEQGLPRELELIGRFPSPHGEQARLFRVPGSLPRAYAVPSARVADGWDALRLLRDPEFDPRAEVLIAHGRGTSAAGPLAASVRTARLGADEVRLEASLDRPGYVVFLETWDPGWKAWVDGRPAEILRANTAFRAVAIESGSHTIEMRYRPGSVRTGALFSLAGLAAAGALLAKANAAGRNPPAERASRNRESRSSSSPTR